MSIKCLNRYLEKNPEVKPTNEPDRKLIIVSDSKGKRLQNIVSTDLERTLKWYARGGLTTRQALVLINDNLNEWLNLYGKIFIVVWTGTCDMTQKNGRYIKLSNISTDDIVEDYEKIASKSNVNVKIVILEVPQYSITIWNQTKGHANPNSFKEESELLVDQTELLNAHIRFINSKVNTESPRFGIDLKRTHKRNKSRTITRFAYMLLTDGIHPGQLISRYWLRQIVIKILLPHCYI
ncbi:MAG: hypothetical protein ABW185_11010 [Sedimenticola sp.]